VDLRRRPGQGRYARPEREQRWVLGQLPDGLASPTAIVDWYLSGTTLRVRRTEAGSEVVYKLGQKVRPDEASPAVVKLTNIYLTEPEYSMLRWLPGHELRKTRWRLSPDGVAAGSSANHGIVVDEFHGHLAGLVLAEIELAPEDALVALPGIAGLDVTFDDRFSGGRLAGASTAEVRDLLTLAAKAG
jgi:CYTH domain-containing protein